MQGTEWRIRTKAAKMSNPLMQLQVDPTKDKSAQQASSPKAQRALCGKKLQETGLRRSAKATRAGTQVAHLLLLL